MCPAAALTLFVNQPFLQLYRRTSAFHPLRTFAFPAITCTMAQPITLFEFPESIIVGSDTLMCIAPLSTLLPYMTLAEINEAFSGHASYRQAPWMTRYVGVWGRKNCQRLRRFLRERGAEIILHRNRPDYLRLTSWQTKGERKKVRFLSQLTS